MKKIERDIAILDFLWRFKVATTGMIHAHLFSDRAIKTAYNVLDRLRKKKLISSRTDEYGKNPVWTIEVKGFKAIRNRLPELREESFKSANRDHDLICSSIHLGEFINDLPKDIELITEQMLRIYHKEFLPSFVPDVDEDRPDGYWYMASGDRIKLISLEVELSQKAFARYEGYSNFYEDFTEDHRCLWVVKTKGHARKILRAMYKIKPDYMIHNFVLLKDILELGWDSIIFAGPEKTQKVSKMFGDNLWKQVGNKRERFYQNLLLDNRLTYQLYSKKPLQTFTQKVDCIGTHN